MRLSLHPLKFILLLALAASCSSNLSDEDPEPVHKQFTKLEPTHTRIKFLNRITDTKEFNYLFYQYMYNGGGVAAGDINNDGLVDLYFAGNQVSNKLYLNKGDLVFEDITRSAGLAEFESWSTGLSMVDINADGWLDIYVCNSASIGNDELRANRFFINNQDNTFTDKAVEMGLADKAYSTQAYFFDHDKDGDLDMYLVNHRIDFENNFDTREEVEMNFSPLHSDKLYRNDEGIFSDITVESGLLNNTWGLSASIGDFNNDGWEDIYVCNDFVQPDHLYINQKDGTFKDEILKRMKHISFYSMGSDLQDINNDGFSDLLVADMVSQDHERSIRNMAAMDAEEFERMDAKGYHKQYMFNTLHLNMGNGEFADIGQLSGLSKTDWSWAPLIVDLDNDGNKDVFVSNGIKRDVTDIDYKERVRMRAVRNDRMGFEEVFGSWPSTRLSNYSFRNNGDLTFENVSKHWGLAQVQNSNGAAYADLDNDGDLDLVLNNIDEHAAIYKNNSTVNFVKIKLKGKDNNIHGIGAIVTTEEFGTGRKQTQTVYPNRGYCSSMNDYLIFACQEKNIHITEVVWPDGNKQVYKGPTNGQVLEIEYLKTNYQVRRSVPGEFFNAISAYDLGLVYEHIEDEFNDFEREVLLPQKKSQIGPFTVAADLNGDGLEDMFIGNAKDATPVLFLQNSSGKFRKSQIAFWSKESKYEDQAAIAIDIDDDSDLDLIVGSGGNSTSADQEDRVYLNDGKGNFTRSNIQIPNNRNTTCFANSEELLFIGGGVEPGRYPFASSSRMFMINDGQFQIIDSEAITELGMTYDALFSDYDQDGDKDLIVVGEWMPVTIIRNDNGQFVEKVELDNTSGWNYSIAAADMDGDGDEDLVIGNLGENNKFKASTERPFHVFANDFDGNGTSDIVLSKEYQNKLLPARGRECSSEQIPGIKDKFPTYTQFGKADLQSIYGEEKLKEALHLQVVNFSSLYLENEGGTFQQSRLPSVAQMGPTLSILAIDVNNDGFLDIVGAGNIYEAEAETISYDANRGYVLLGDGKGSFRAASNTGFYYNSNARELELIEVGGESHLVLLSNNDELKLFRKK
ncbi:MAG: VCBS repeat-containing protein [Flavobacteriales bacterium]|nr:VCBS repeat-containing protein [Flavobacteriales bacterium]